MLPSILIVDDEPSILQALSGILSDEGFEVQTAQNGYEALKIIEEESPDLVLLDIWMPGIDGMDTLKEIKKENPYIQVIMITGHGTIETAVKATKLGAFDFIEKPLSFDKIVVAINNALNFRKLEEHNRYLRKKTIEKHSITGNSLIISQLKKEIMTVAPTESWVLIKGENGTGKELIARTIHQLSPRAMEPLIDVNCAAIPDELIESELFGHEKGSVSWHSKKSRGRFELANKGTIFFDEIGDMSLKTQSKILRVLQEKKFQRIGGNRVLSVDVRVIASTNKDLEDEIKRGNFREDLFYRLNVVPITVPPLRERKDDISLLSQKFFDEFSKGKKGSNKILSESALNLLLNYSWPGNVRELKNLIERLSIMTGKEFIDDCDIPSPYNPSQENHTDSEISSLFEFDNFKDAKTAFEKEFIKKKLYQHNYNITNTAKLIGVERSYLHKKIRKIKEENKN